jgi:hypothetical protein
MTNDEKQTLLKTLHEMQGEGYKSIRALIADLEKPESMAPAEAVAELNTMDSMHDSASLHERADQILLAVLRWYGASNVVGAHLAASERCNFLCYCAYDE